MILPRRSILAAVSLATVIMLSIACSGSSPSTPAPAATKPTPVQQQNAPRPGGPAVLAKPTPKVVLAQVKSVVQSKPVEPIGNGARLQAKIDDADYGDVGLGDVVDQVFEFSNVGSQPLNVETVTIKTVEGC